ncbi:MAG: 5-(carboxyamino)imidazole ribonucleotide synthase [Herminiimonas sp.]|nr:5-(carboxyamino)imidazole ribonucleotide synthase [Herminiimonas sp.]
MSDQRAFIPGASPATWLGVMGGGQLGRMFAHAAQAMGFKIAVLETTPDCPAGHAADHLLCADYADPAALAELGAQCVAVTTEFENVPAQSLRQLAAHAFVAPSADCVAIAQDRMAEKRFFTGCATASGVLPAPHHLIERSSDIDNVSALLLPGLLKTVRLGYDGKGQVRVATIAELKAAFDGMQGAACVLEQMLPLACEVSVLVARSADGLALVYPIAENMHRNGVLHTTTVPAAHASADAEARAQAAALVFVAELDYVGVLCIEFFILADGSLVVNEMAPRPHNSGHYTIDACVTSQFAQQVRAMARLPLGDVRQHSPAVMLNLLGDLWFGAAGDATEDSPSEPAWDRILALPGACLHLYGKEEARRGRKMGHVTFVAPTMMAARASFVAACAILGIVP